MRALVISNCQAGPLAHALALHCRGVSVDALQVHTLNDNNRHLVQDALKTDYDFVVATPLSDAYGEISSNRISDHFRAVCKIPVIYFAGLHPDLTYIGGLGKRLQGPLGDYHSKIVVASYFLGVDQSVVVSAFSDNVFGALGYYSVFDQSLRALQEREKDVDVPVSDIVISKVRDGLPMYSVNHPSSLVIGPFAARLADYLAKSAGVELTKWPAGYGVQDGLARSAVFPVYPPIASRFSCPAGSFEFKPITQGNAPVSPLNLQEFISAEFHAIKSSGADNTWPAIELLTRTFSPVLNDLL